MVLKVGSMGGPVRSRTAVCPQCHQHSAGTLRMPLGTFALFTLLGSTVWNAILIAAGMALGENWCLISNTVGSYGPWVARAGLMVIAVAVAIKHLRSTAPS